MKKFKEEDLILYLYKECPPKLSTAIEEALNENLKLKDRLEVLRRTIRQLDKLKLASPSRQTIKTILKYADASARKKP